MTPRKAGARGARARKAKPPRRSPAVPQDLARELRPELWDIRDPGFNLWAARDTARDLKRAPGLFWPHRQSRGAAWLGIPTFFKLPIALTPDDLRAGKVDVAIFGAPLDMGFGMRGAAFGPQAIRVSERYVSWADARSGATRPHQHVRIDPFHVLTVVDYGDVAIDPFSTERSVGHVQEFVRGIAETGAVPLMIGGDHSLLWPGAAGVADVYGRGSVGVIHFDAHADASHSMLGHLAAHGTPVRRLIVDAHIPGRNFIQVGLRGYYPDDDTVEWMRSVGMRSHYMAEVERKGWDVVLRRALEEALDVRLARHIRLDGDGRPALGPDGPDDLLRPPFLPDVVHADGVAAFRAEPAHGGPDAAAPSRHDQNAAHRALRPRAARRGPGSRVRITRPPSSGDRGSPRS